MCSKECLRALLIALYLIHVILGLVSRPLSGWGVRSGSEEVVRALLRGAEAVTSPGVVRKADPNKGMQGETAGFLQFPLLLAVASNKAAIAAVLLRAGASCEATLAMGENDFVSLLGLAKRRRDYDTMQVLAADPTCVRVDENLESGGWENSQLSEGGYDKLQLEGGDRVGRKNTAADPPDDVPSVQEARRRGALENDEL